MSQLLTQIRGVTDTLQSIMQEPYFIPSDTPLFTQSQHFQENHEGIGVVVDRYGELQDLVSL